MQYKLQETQHRFQYCLTGDDEIIIASDLYSVCMEYIYEHMKEGDTYQETAKDGVLADPVGYTAIMNSKKRDDLFDQGLI